VEVDRGGVALDQLGDRFREAPRPCLVLVVELFCHNPVPMEQAKAEGVGKDYKETVAPGAAGAAGKARRQTEGAPAPVVPDCCNIGVCLRAIVILNIAAVVVAIALAPDLAAIWPRLLGFALVLEPTL